MPRDFPKNKDALKTKHHYIKYHQEMTEEEKANIARCDGEKDNHPCKNPVFKCTKCGNYGCDQEETDVCTIQGFKNGKCLHCRSQGTLAPVMNDEYDEVKKDWEEIDY